MKGGFDGHLVTHVRRRRVVRDRDRHPRGDENSQVAVVGVVVQPVVAAAPVAVGGGDPAGRYQDHRWAIATAADIGDDVPRLSRKFRSINHYSQWTRLAVSKNGKANFHCSVAVVQLYVVAFRA